MKLCETNPELPCARRTRAGLISASEDLSGWQTLRALRARARGQAGTGQPIRREGLGAFSGDRAQGSLRMGAPNSVAGDSTEEVLQGRKAERVSSEDGRGVFVIITLTDDSGGSFCHYRTEAFLRPDRLHPALFLLLAQHIIFTNKMSRFRRMGESAFRLIVDSPIRRIAKSPNRLFADSAPLT